MLNIDRAFSSLFAAHAGVSSWCVQLPMLSLTQRRAREHIVAEGA